MRLQLPITLQISATGQVRAEIHAAGRQAELEAEDLAILSRLLRGERPEALNLGRSGLADGQAGLRRLFDCSIVVDGSRPGNDERAAWPVFLIGGLRSGTTLLRYLFDAHEHLACPPESKFLAALEQFIDYPQVAKALGTLLTQEEFTRELRIFVNRVLGTYAAKHGKRRWVDKTPNYYRILPFIDELFSGQVLYVFLARHPFDCVASLEKYFRQTVHHEDPDIARNTRDFGKGRYAWLRYWMDVYTRIRVFASAHPQRCRMVRYEDLVCNTSDVLRDALEFIAEPYDERLPERAFQSPHTSGYQDSNIRATRQVHQSSLCRWQAWEPSEIAALWEPVAGLAAQFGYSCSPPGYAESFRVSAMASRRESPAEVGPGQEELAT